MAYSIISVMALLLNLILNRETLIHFKFRSGEQSKEQRTATRYSYFLAASNCYFITDIAWGLLYEQRSTEPFFSLLYVDCVLYYLFMFITMLAWMRYIVVYLDRYGRESKMLLYVAWCMFTAALIGLVVNCFYPVIFSFDANHDYVTESGRHLSFICQLCLCLVTSAYVFLTARKATKHDKARYNAVGWTCLAMEVFILLQVMDPDLPTHAMGLLFAIVVIHSFVESGERKEKETYDHIVACLADDYTAMYYINLETGEYREFPISKKYGCMNVPTEGRNFFEDVQKNIEIFVHPDDREFAHSMYRKEMLLKKLENRKSASCKYRLMINGQPRYFQYTVNVPMMINMCFCTKKILMTRSPLRICSLKIGKSISHSARSQNFWQSISTSFTTLMQRITTISATNAEIIMESWMHKRQGMIFSQIP